MRAGYRDRLWMSRFVIRLRLTVAAKLRPIVGIFSATINAPQTNTSACVKHD
jgi:hypothetical protein